MPTDVGMLRHKIKFRKSEENQNCDALSRLPLQCTNPEKLDATSLAFINFIEQTLPIDFHKIKAKTQKDRLLCKIYEHIVTGTWPTYTQNCEEYRYFIKRNEFSIEQGCIMWGNRVVIPSRNKLNLETAFCSKTRTGNSLMRI